jgi:uncharacterized protein
VTSGAAVLGSVLLDTAVPLYASGGPSAHRQSCLEVMEAVVDGRIEAMASTEMIQEFVFHRLQRTGSRQRSVADARNLTEVTTVLDFGATVLDNALHLIEQVPGIRGRDAVHAATALVFGIPAIVSPDRALDGIPGLRRVDPSELAAFLNR